MDNEQFQKEKENLDVIIKECNEVIRVDGGY